MFFKTLVLAACLWTPSLASACVAADAMVPINIPAWNGGYLAVASTARAPQDCPGPGHPILQVDFSSATAWVHVVETSAPDPLAPSGSWVFVDVSTAARAAGIPFYSEGPSFWDNPSWSKPAKELFWRGTVFAVRVAGKRITPIAAVRWGFHWEPSRLVPRPLPVQAGTRGEWQRRMKIFKKNFPAWDWR